MTGLSLRDAMVMWERFGRGTPLGHLRAPQLAAIREVSVPGEHTRHARDHFVDAFVERRAVETIGRGTGRFEGVYFHPGEPADAGPDPHHSGWSSGDFDEYRGELLALAASGHPLAGRVTVEDRGPDALVLRFDFDQGLSCGPSGLRHP
ncbi:hypothetical protein AB0I28_30835 [Phytomonospora sp. NPDC050363]|uniref:hypothetical protein n=1 Tax=Phytomonospora sp. NPDC050363 TaxID=3155642 RepID=UPI0034046D6A